MNNDQHPPELEQPEPKPVAYDAEGQPLYAAPPAPKSKPPVGSHVHSAPERPDGHNYDPRMRVQYSNEPQVVHHTRPHEPEEHQISDKLRLKHKASVKKYPELSLSDGEYVIKSVTRHPIGLIIPVVVTIVVIAILLFALITYPLVAWTGNGTAPAVVYVSIILLCLIVLVGLGGYAAVWVYLRNAFYLTNESVIQQIQHSIFSRHEQTVSIGSVEDASYRQVGVFQTMFNYGTIQLSTEGDESTYQFSFVDNPRKQIAIINNAIESFKSGRPVVEAVESEEEKDD